MERRYRDLCTAYHCKSRVYTKLHRDMQNFGSPDLLILFTGEMSHKMVHSALSSIRGTNTRVARVGTGSMSALRKVLEEHVGSMK